MRLSVIARFLTASMMLAVLISPSGWGQDRVVNLYSSRHYQTDEALYLNFTRLTGIKINRIEGTEDALLERLKNEGRNSPADVLITFDVTRLWRGGEMEHRHPCSA